LGLLNSHALFKLVEYQDDSSYFFEANHPRQQLIPVYQHIV